MISIIKNEIVLLEPLMEPLLVQLLLVRGYLGVMAMKEYFIFSIVGLPSDGSMSFLRHLLG